MEQIKEAYPLTWPAGFARTQYPQPSRFKASLATARDRLLYELERMGARHVILSTNIPIRNDGLPYAKHAEPADSGVAVYFKLTRKGKTEDVVLACDKWRKVAENLRSLFLTVEAMRGLDRWGCSEILERVFTGFAALPAPAPFNWRQVFGWSDAYRPDREELDLKYKEHARARHPDTATGSHEAFTELQKARAAALEELGA